MFDGIVGQLEHFRNMMEGYVDQTETAGYIVSQKYYTALIDNEEATLSQLNEERNQLISSLNDARSPEKKYLIEKGKAIRT